MTSPDPDDELAVLPRRYAAALRLARSGVSPARIAAELDIPVESVATALVLAEAKLKAATDRATRGRTVPERTGERARGTSSPRDG